MASARAEVGRPSGTARKRFNDNKDRLNEGEDYFVRNSDEAKQMGLTAPNGITFITESGYLLLVKSFTDDLAWQVQKQLVKAYFAAGSPNQIQTGPETITPSEQQTLSEIAHRKAEPFGALQGKALAEIWSRLHNKFRIAKYSQLPRTQLADAIVYITSMEVRSAKPTSSAPEVLSASDMHNITRLVWLMTHQLRFESSWSQAIWKQLRLATDTQSPNRFRVDQIPRLADELTRIYAITDAFTSAVNEAEHAMVKRVLRNNEAAEAVLAEMRSKLMAAATEEVEQAGYFFQRFAGKEIEHFAKRLPNLGARYPHAEEKAA